MPTEGKKITFGIGALAILALIGLLYVANPSAPSQSTDSAQQEIVAEPVPEMTPFMKEVLDKSKGFQFLVSYTDGGFEPTSATIKAGQTVRFTNNSSHELWVSAAAVGTGKVYPLNHPCAASAFDSCVRMKPKEFWEFTFDERGTWGYKNVSSPEKTGVIIVQ